MKYRHHRLHTLAYAWHCIGSEFFFAILLVLFVFISPVSASMRLQERSLYINSSKPGATTFYTVSFRFASPQPIGSVDMLFCVNPIPYMPCVTPPGLDVSGAVLSNQSGETGFSILSKSTNHITLTRPSGAVSSVLSSYTFDNIVNPTDPDQAFSIRLRSHSSTDATGPLVDFGSVRSQVTTGVKLETQVPPMLLFCVAEKVSDGCSATNDVYYSDTGLLSAKTTLKSQSEMAVGTNASNGFAITARGAPLSAGIHVIDSLTKPTGSQSGKNQFGINLVHNNNPSIGSNPEISGNSTVPTADYGIPNRYKFVSGDVVAYSTSVSLMERFTVSYIINSKADLPAGVYTTTVNYIASGRF